MIFGHKNDLFAVNVIMKMATVPVTTVVIYLEMCPVFIQVPRLP